MWRLLLLVCIVSDIAAIDDCSYLRTNVTGLKIGDPEAFRLYRHVRKYRDEDTVISFKAFRIKHPDVYEALVECVGFEFLHFEAADTARKRAISLHLETVPYVLTGLLEPRLFSSCVYENTEDKDGCSRLFYPLPNLYESPLFNYSPLEVEFWKYFQEEYMFSPKWITEIRITSELGSIPSDWIAYINVSSIRNIEIGGNDWGRPQKIIGHLPQLQNMALVNNKLQILPQDIFEKAPVLRNVTWKDNCSFQLWPGMEQFKIFHIMGYNNTSVLNASENETSLSLSGVVMLTVENTTIFTNMNTIFLLPSLRSLKIIFCDLPNIKYDDEHITEGESQISVLHIFYSNVSDIPIKLFSKLLYATNINLTGNSLTKCPNYAFNGLSQVLELTLSYNLISDIESHCLSNMESLEVLDLSFNNLSMLGENIFQGLHNLVYLVLSNNKFSSVGNNALFPLTNLGVLVLSNNQLIEEPRINSDFMYTVNLSHNYLSSVTHITETTTEIVDLDLSFNNIRNLNINNVENLNLSYNSLQELPYTLASALDDMKIVDLGANILFCCHENITMLRNYTTKIRNLGVANFAECEVNGARIVLDGNVTYDSVCGEIQDIINHANIWTITVILSMLVVAFMVFIHYYRAELAYIGHLFKMRKIGLRNDDDRYNMCTYDAFVCYSGKDFEFVSTQLLANLEGGPEGYRFCVHDRDFTLGVAIDTNVRISLQKSRKVIFLLSEDFVTSKWCQLELEMANHKMFEEDRNYIILVNLERLDREKLPLHLRYLMDTRTYLEWPEDTENEKHVERCWQRLRFALGDSIGKKTGKPYKEGTVLDV